jgi:hypothetical protein
LDEFFFPSHAQQAPGSQGANAWTRTVDAKVTAWSLGPEYLVTPFQGLPRLSIGAGVHLVHWQVQSTDTTVFQLTGGGTSTMALTSSPTWNRLGVSLLADCRLTDHLALEARWLTSSYGWQGERTQIAQAGLLWRF